MSENTNPQEPRQPRNLFEQILFGVQVTNDNIVTLHGRVDARYTMHYTLPPSLMPPARKKK